MVIGPVAIIQSPTQAIYGPKPAAKYLGMHVQTLKKLTDEGVIKAKWNPYLNRREWLWSELEAYIKNLEEYNPNHGEGSGVERSQNGR